MTTTVAVAGLGSIGAGAARALLRAGFAVRGFDVRPDAGAALTEAGGTFCPRLSEAADGASTLLVFVVDAAQTWDVLAQALPALPAGAVVVSSATIAPDDAQAIGAGVEAAGRLFLDAPSSGGPVRAAEGSMILMASGSDEAFAAAEPVLMAIARKVHRVGTRAGDGSRLKLINQLLAGVHIAAAAEALTLATKLGLDPAAARAVLTEGAAASFMLDDRGGRMLEATPAVRSAIDILLKDLGIVTDAGRRERFPLPLASAALQLFQAAANVGLGREDDSALAKVYERAAGIELRRG